MPFQAVNVDRSHVVMCNYWTLAQPRSSLSRGFVKAISFKCVECDECNTSRRQVQRARILDQGYDDVDIYSADRRERIVFVAVSEAGDVAKTMFGSGLIVAQERSAGTER